MTASVNYIQSKYGSYKGLLRHIKTQVALRSGVYSHLSVIEWSRVERLIFVCKGNVCRSPYAEAKAAQMGIPVGSCGIDTRGDTPANNIASRCALQRGLDLSKHRSKRINDVGFLATDLVFFFEPGHITSTKRYFANTNAQLSLIGLWSSPRYPFIPDPYGKSEEYFYNCFGLIDLAINQIASLMQK